MSHLATLPPSVLNDAVDVARLLWDPDHCAYPADQVRLLLDEQATSEKVLDGLRWLSNRADRENTVVVYFSGHGLKGGGESDSRIACWDACSLDPDVGTLTATELSERLNGISSDRLAVILDCCYAGSMVRFKNVEEGPFPQESLTEDDLYRLIGRGQGRALLASSGHAQPSLAANQGRNSPFTSFMLEALRGAATRLDDEVVDLLDVFRYVRDQMGEKHPGQIPFLHAMIHDPFPIALAPRGSNHPPELTDPAIDENVAKRTINQQEYRIDQVNVLDARQGHGTQSRR